MKESWENWRSFSPLPEALTRHKALIRTGGNSGEEVGLGGAVAHAGILFFFFSFHNFLTLLPDGNPVSVFPRTAVASDALNFSKLPPNMDVYSKPTVNSHNRAPGARAPNRGAIPPLSSSLPPALLSPSVPGPEQAGGGGRGLGWGL